MGIKSLLEIFLKNYKMEDKKSAKQPDTDKNSSKKKTSGLFSCFRRDMPCTHRDKQKPLDTTTKPNSNNSNEKSQKLSEEGEIRLESFVTKFFEEYDKDKNGSLNGEEFATSFDLKC